MWFVEIVATYLYALKFVAIVLAVLLLISGLDDLIIDVIYWTRRAWRRVTVYRTHDRLDSRELYAPSEKPLAIMIPAWHETGVIGRMAELAARTLDYENYHVFVGTYPNDPETQRDVDDVCARYRNVQKVVCARPGPTSKADCLNNVLDGILQFERRANLQFEGFILHDAEDVISPLELRLFNYLVARKDLIQLPVYPLERKWTDFTSAHYMDEFAELHAKDIPVREALVGQVPSAGVGTCFSRRALMTLLADGDGVAFDVQSLTEDYDIGFRLRARGMREIFVRLPVAQRGHDQEPRSRRVGQSRSDATVVCVREFFPNTFAAAVRQKSRWIIGIVFQGFTTHKWTGEPWLDYFLWRDRKGGLSNFVSFLAMALLIQLVAVWLYEALVPDSYRFLSVFEGGRWLRLLLLANLVLMVNRIAHRVFFVSRYYGLREGLLAIPRIAWGNVINFTANWRALRKVIASGDARRVAWDKTTHDFPLLGERSRVRRPLGRILVEQGVITDEQLADALTHRARGLRLGSWLVHEGTITAAQLAAAVAEQSGVPWERVETTALDAETIALLSAEAALRYAVLPLREEGATLVVGCEGDLDPVSLAALARKIGRPVRYVIVPKGQVAVGLRHWHVAASVDGSAQSPRTRLSRAVRAGTLSEDGAAAIWDEYVSRQVLFTEILMSLGHLDALALNSVLLRHDGRAALGDYLVREEVISAEALGEALRIQRTLQGSLETLVARAAWTPPSDLPASGTWA